MLPSFFSHLKNSLVYQVTVIFQKLLEMLHVQRIAKKTRIAKKKCV